ncbi:MAG: PIN domain-containing protein [Gemmatimonadota bacterium]|nr:PIN domain-containing protein [Gemmatimonadota bacterium]
MRVLFDTNVILDVLLARAPHVGPAVALLDRVAGQDLEGLLGATTITTIHYLATEAVGAAQAHRHIRTLLGLFEVAPVTRAALTDALDLGYPDFEDAVLHEAARHAGARAIVTRDPKGFPKPRLKVYAPDELLRFIRATPQR